MASIAPVVSRSIRIREVIVQHAVGVKDRESNVVTIVPVPGMLHTDAQFQRQMTSRLPRIVNKARRGLLSHIADGRIAVLAVTAQ